MPPCESAWRQRHTQALALVVPARPAVQTGVAVRQTAVALLMTWRAWWTEAGAPLLPPL